MKLKSSQRKSIAAIPTAFKGQERRYAQSVSENLDTLSGRRGNIIDRAVTFRDLLDSGVLKLAGGILSEGGVAVTNPNDPNSDPDGPIELPTKPSTLVATGGFDAVFLNWSLPPYRGHDYIEIFRFASDNLVSAEAAGAYTRYYGDQYFYIDTNVSSQETWYYWVRAVNKNGVVGPFNDSAGTAATTALDYLYIAGLIDDVLDDDVNNLGLNTTIDALDLNITQLENFSGYTSSYSGDTLLTRIGSVETVAGNAASSAQLQVEQTARTTADTALASDITTLNTTVNNPTTGLPATYAGLQSEISTRAGADSALATRATSLEATVNNGTTGVAATYAGLQSEQTARTTADTALSQNINSLSTTVGGNTSSIQTQTSSINGIQAKYAVKIDNNGHVSGFGLISTANNGTPTSSFIVAADRFAIASTNINPAFPFKVITSATTINGAYVPAGVYIKDVFIHDAQITTAAIKDATITDGKIVDLTAGKITSGEIIIDNSNDIAIRQGKTSYSSNANGFWLGNNNGSGAFNIGNATNYLKFDGSTMSVTGASINDLSVSTLKIGPNAVTVPDADYGSVGSMTLNSSTYVTIAEVSNFNVAGFNNIAASLTVTGGVSISGNSSAVNLCLISLWEGSNRILEHGITVDGFGSYYGVVAREFPVYNYTDNLSVKIRAYSTSKAISSAQGWVTVMGTQR